MELTFEWDKNKAKANLRKHKISFDEAKTIFNDPLTITFRDDFHSDEEDRLISVGMSANNRILLVVNTESEESENAFVVRIISCRKATASERKIYEKG
jgi:hypothetical protein